MSTITKGGTRYLETVSDFVQKFAALHHLLAGQAIILGKATQAALQQYQTKGDNAAQLIEGFYATIEAIEAVVKAQLIFGGEKQTEFVKYLQDFKAAFRRLDMGADPEDAAVQKAMAERKTATIH